MSDLGELRRKRHLRPDDLLPVLEQVAERFARYEKLFDALQARLLLVDELPAEAPFGALIRLRQGTVAQRTPLYMGNGPGQPLSKLTPTPL